MFDEALPTVEDAVKNLRGQGAGEGNIEGALKDVRRALLEADVSLQVVKDFVKKSQRPLEKKWCRASARTRNSSRWSTSSSSRPWAARTLPGCCRQGGPQPWS